MKISGIYKFTNKLNGKIYIGQSSNVTTRLHNHLSKDNESDLKLDIDKYGLNSFKFEILEFIINNSNLNDELNEKEQYYIDLHISMGINFETMFYNKIRFINDGKFIISEDQKTNMSIARSGVRLSTEHRESMSKASIKNESFKYLQAKKRTPKEISDSLKKALRAKAKGVVQYTLDGEYVNNYVTQKDAADALNVGAYNINKALKGVMNQAYGYQWRYGRENFPKKIDSILRKVKAFDYDKNEVGIFDSPAHAAYELNLDKNRIYYALNESKYNYTQEYYFFYID
jgi:group I intron endonuclease